MASHVFWQSRCRVIDLVQAPMFVYFKMLVRSRSSCKAVTAPHLGSMGDINWLPMLALL